MAAELPPFTFTWGKASREPQTRPCPVGFGQDPSGMVTLLGTLSLGYGGPRSGLAQSQPPPPAHATKSTKHLDLNILLCLYNMYRIYSIGILFPSRLQVSPKMTSFINKYIYIEGNKRVVPTDIMAFQVV